MHIVSQSSLFLQDVRSQKIACLYDTLLFYSFFIFDNQIHTVRKRCADVQSMLEIMYMTNMQKRSEDLVVIATLCTRG